MIFDWFQVMDPNALAGNKEEYISVLKTNEKYFILLILNEGYLYI